MVFTYKVWGEAEMQTLNTAEMPVVIEAAITPLRFGEPVQSMEQTIEESRACLAAGAAIIHHHHDFSAPPAEGVRQMVGIQAGILEAFPGALMYSDYLNGTGIWEKNAHLRPLHDAGLLRMIPLDPAIVQALASSTRTGFHRQPCRWTDVRPVSRSSPVRAGNQRSDVD